MPTKMSLQAPVEPVSLYLDLEKGAKADLEAVARAVLAFTDAVQEMAFIIDPSLEIRIELVSGTEGSLSINSLLRGKAKDLLSRRNLIAVAATSIFWFTLDTAGHWTVEKILDHLVSSGHAKQFSEEEMNVAAGRVLEALEKKIASQHVQRVYRELEADPAVKGVGASTTPGKKPALIVPRSQFPARSGGVQEQRPADERRIRHSFERVTLISPVLVAGTRRWRFSGKEGEFGATIKDVVFLESVLAGRLPVPMVAGIQMDIDLEVHEHKEGGAWNVTERTVTRVRRVLPPIVQMNMDLSTPQDSDDRDNEDNK